MRIPLRLPARNVTPGDAQPAPPGPGKSGVLATNKPPAVRVSLSTGGLDACRKAVSPTDAASPEPAHRTDRRRGGLPRVAPAAQVGGRILELQRRLLQEHPDLRCEARAAIEARLLHDHGLHLNADRTYFNVFRGGHSSRQTYNGWEHNAAPLNSLSLTELQMRNFPADLGEDPNGLNANTGIYTEGRTGKSFGTANEVRLLSTDVKSAVRANDVGGAYREKLKTWWNRNEQDVVTLYQAQARKWRRHGGLSEEAGAILREVLRVADGKAVQSKVTAHVFDINSYPSKDMTWLKGVGRRVVLLMPGDRQPVREYDSLDSMREAIQSMTRTSQGRAGLAAHFSVYNRKDGTTYQGVEKWLGDIAGGGYLTRIAYTPQRIEGNVFRDLVARTRAAELDDIKRLVKSNSEVIEEESTQFVRVLGQLFPELFLPAKATELALDVHQAVADGAAEDRRRAAHDATVAGINLAAATALGALATPIRRVSTAAEAGAGRAAYFNPPGRIGGGRIGYLLGPAEAPRPPSSLDDLGGQINEVDVGIIAWDDDALTLSPSTSRSSSPWNDTASGSGGASPATTRSSSSSPAPHLGWWAPGQEPVMGESPPLGGPPPSPVTPPPGFGVIGNEEGLPYFNAANWIERLDMAHVYRPVSLETLAARSPEIEGFEADMSIGGEGITINGRYLFTVETQQAALDYGNERFGAGNFAVFQIETDGVPAMPYRLNINYDMWNTSPPVTEARAAGQPVAPDIEWLSSYVHAVPETPGEVPAGYEALEADDLVSYQRSHVFIDNHGLQPSRIHRTL